MVSVSSPTPPLLAAPNFERPLQTQHKAELLKELNVLSNLQLI